MAVFPIAPSFQHSLCPELHFMSWDLIIFDCDGVLVDSEPIAERVFPQVLAEEGFEVVLDDARSWFTGYSLQTCLKWVEALFGRPVPDTMGQKYYSRLFDEFKKSLQPIPGIVEALDAIPYPVCVASSGAHEKMRISLGITGLLPRFTGRIFSALDVAHGKPAPDLFLHAAIQCNADPNNCAVIEDSIPGVTAGIAAGMKVFGFITPYNTALTDTFREYGAVIFTAMCDLPDLLKQSV
jgi:HAD superfamily hydrolase (TIGR01509 family)